MEGRVEADDARMATGAKDGERTLLDCSKTSFVFFHELSLAQDLDGEPLRCGHMYCFEDLAKVMKHKMIEDTRKRTVE